MNDEHIATETTALTTIEATPARIPIEQDTEMLGRAMVASGYFKDTTSASQAIVKILAGREVGLPPIASMTGIHVIEGKVTMGANIVAAVIKRSGRYNYRVREHTDERCAIEFFEGRESLGVSTFTLEDARRANLAHKPIWQRYAKNMLFARALTNGARWHTPDIFGGAVYTPEELDAEPLPPLVSADIVQSVQEDDQASAPAPKPVAQPTNGHAAPPDDDEPVSVHSDDGLDAVQRALKTDLDQEQGVVVDFGPKSQPADRAANFSERVEAELQKQMQDVTKLLGMSVKEYMADPSHRCPTLEVLYSYLAAWYRRGKAFPGVELSEGAKALVAEVGATE